MFDRFADEAKLVLNEARRAASSFGAGELDDLHILVACCRTPDTLALRVLRDCGQDPELLAQSAERLARASATGARADGTLPFTPLARRVLERMMEEASNLDHKALGAHHILLGLLASGGPASEILLRHGLDPARASAVAYRVHEDLDVEPIEQVDPAIARTKKGEQIKILLAAKDVCVELQQFEVASQLRDLAHWLEHS